MLQVLAPSHDDDAVAGGDSGPIVFVRVMLGAGMVDGRLGPVGRPSEPEPEAASGLETRPETPSSSAAQ